MHPFRRAAALALAACVPACHPPPTAKGGATIAPVSRPEGPLSAEEAGRYVLELVNRDRAAEGLGRVEWDATAAAAARQHVTDMTRSGYAGHWGTDGSVPEQRYTGVGGEDIVRENAACFGDAEKRELDPHPTFLAADLEAIEAVFMAEKPPHDGHRKNILARWHNRLGVAVAKPAGIRQPCMAQEFVDAYGSYAALPATARVGKGVTVKGEVTAPARFAGVGISRIEPARPTPARELLGRSTYPTPEPYVLYSPPGYVTPKPVQVQGSRFTIDVPLSDKGLPGRYGVSVWAVFPGSTDLVMVSLRVVNVTR